MKGTFKDIQNEGYSTKGTLEDILKRAIFLAVITNIKT